MAKSSFERQEGLDKLRGLIDAINVCMFITRAKETNRVRPMATMQADSNGDLWFFTKLSSPKIADIKHDNNVQLLYSHPGKDSYLDVLGQAYIETSKEKIESLWTPLAKAWFPDGIDDPEICLLRVEVVSAYYWDSGTSKMVSFFKMVAAAVTGKQLAEGEEGALIP